MRTYRFYHAHLGISGRDLPQDSEGYVTIHDSPRYERASQVRLNEWAESRLAAVRAAALTELAMRKLIAWWK